MKILALETSTMLASVAIVKDGHLLCERRSERQRTHSEVVSGYVDQCLQEAQLKLSDIDVFAVGLGPGSFTGIRIAGNLAKTFAYSFAKPLVAIDSLTLLAEQHRQTKLPVLSIINAYKNMVYLGLFDFSEPVPQFTYGPTAVSVRDLSTVIHQECLVVGDGYAAFQEYFPPELKKLLHRPDQALDYPEARTLGLLAHHKALANQTIDWNSYTPLYIRASEAEENKRGILIKPLK